MCRSVVGTHHRLPSNGSSSSSSLLLTTTKNDNNNNNNSGSEEKDSGSLDDPSTFKLAAKESGGLVHVERGMSENDDEVERRERKRRCVGKGEDENNDDCCATTSRSICARSRDGTGARRRTRNLALKTSDLASKNFTFLGTKETLFGFVGATRTRSWRSNGRSRTRVTAAIA